MDCLERIWRFEPKYCVFGSVLLLCLEKICSLTFDGFLVDFVGCRIKCHTQDRSMERISGRNNWTSCSLYWLQIYASFSCSVLERRGDSLSTKRPWIKITSEIIRVLRFRFPSTILHHSRLKWTIFEETSEYNQRMSLFESNNSTFRLQAI